MITNTIRDYKIISKLGEGGMGSVYLAEDLNLERKVAIKILNPLLTQDNKFTERFRQEAKVQASLIHPNIVALYNFFQEQENYCMVMEYAEGITLKELIQKSGALPEERAISIFRQILEGVGYAHSKGIIHRDIKPGNIIIGEGDSIKVMDFGIAKILGDKNLTKTGTKMGTLYYMSPEQVRAEKDIDQRTDIYSLGITLYEMLTGKVPFNTETESEFEIMNEIVNKEIEYTKTLAVNISNKVITVICDMTTKNKENRVKIIAEIFPKLLIEENCTVNQKNGAEQNETIIVNKDEKIGKLFIGTMTVIIGIIITIIIYIQNKGEKANYKDPLNPNMVFIEGGNFLMGSDKGEANEKPVHHVTLTSFYINKYETTVKEYREFCKQTGRSMPREPDWGWWDKGPMVNITWNDAVEYCNWISNNRNKKYRLPTEAEWEYVAKGGKSSTFLFDQEDYINKISWNINNSNILNAGRHFHIVGKKRPNELGIYDILGNVEEWCSDWYGEYKDNKQSNPIGPSFGEYKIFRGGHWNTTIYKCRPSYRRHNGKEHFSECLGFRLVMEVN